MNFRNFSVYNDLLVRGCHKRRLQSEKVRFVQYGHCMDMEKGEGRFFTCGRPHFLVQKAYDFSKFMVCPYGKREMRGIEPVRTFFGQWGGGQFFADVFINDPLLLKTWCCFFVGSVPQKKVETSFLTFYDDTDRMIWV